MCPRGASDQRVAFKLGVLFCGPHNFALMHQVPILTFYLQNLKSLGFSGVSKWALGPQGCIGSKSGIKAGCTILRSPTTLLLCTKSEFQLFI